MWHVIVADNTQLRNHHIIGYHGMVLVWGYGGIEYEVMEAWGMGV